MEIGYKHTIIFRMILPADIPQGCSLQLSPSELLNEAGNSIPKKKLIYTKEH